MDTVQRAFDRAILGSSRSTKRFNARLELNDFVGALRIIADAKFITGGSVDSHKTKTKMRDYSSASRMSRLLFSVSNEAVALTQNAPLRASLIQTFRPCVDDESVFLKLAAAQIPLYNAYTRSKQYGLLAHPSMFKGICAEEEGTFLPLAAGNVAENASSHLRKQASRKSKDTKEPTTASTEPAFATQDKPSAFEIFCRNHQIVPNLTSPVVVKRISQYIRSMIGENDDEQGFRYFFGCLCYTCLSFASHAPSGVLLGDEAESAKFSEAVDTILCSSLLVA